MGSTREVWRGSTDPCNQDRSELMLVLFYLIYKAFINEPRHPELCESEAFKVLELSGKKIAGSVFDIIDYNEYSNTN